ncbi:MAG: VWA domain-containing protein [Proteobacteria bacterium]|nr:VWA domain-containing protein [Pseudomonadota bacterium]
MFNARFKSFLIQSLLFSSAILLLLLPLACKSSSFNRGQALQSAATKDSAKPSPTKEVEADDEREPSNGVDSANNGANNGATKGVKPPYGTPVTHNVDNSGWADKPVLNELGGRLQNDGAGNNNKVPTQLLETNSDGVLWLPCTGKASSAGSFPSDFYGRKGVKVRVSGEFCPVAEAQGPLTLVFVVDHSGSMEGAPTEGPNDLTINGSCGRLKVAENLIARYSKTNGTALKIGVVGFSNKARVQVPIIDLSSFKSNLTAGIFCGSDSSLALTNYEAAFNTAAMELQSVQGQKLVYFISDGAPTAGTGDDKEAGLAAALGLRSLPNLTLFALFVGYTAGGAFNPQGYLEQLTGNPALVRVTSNAAELAQSGASLGHPLAKIAQADVSARLENLSGAKNIPVEKFILSDAAANKYMWLTPAFELIGKQGATSLNSLTVTARTSTGEVLKTSANINYHQAD